MEILSKPSALLATAAVVAMTVAFLYRQTRKSNFGLNATKYIPFTLIEKENISHDTRRFRFALQTSLTQLGLPVGNHMYLKASIGGKDCIRSYTPISSDSDVGYFDLCIKVYHKNVHPKYPEGGQMSQYLDSMKMNDSILVRGPVGSISYNEPSVLTHKKKGEIKVKNIGLIAGGTGITPCFQILKKIATNDNDETHVSLLFANQSIDDILLRNELEFLAQQRPNIKIWYTIDREPPTEENWKYSMGHVNAEMIKEHLPGPGEDSVILMCGPPPMIKFALIPALESLGYDKERCLQF